MPTIKRLIEAKDKTKFLLDSYLSNQFYSQLAILGVLPPKTRKEIAREIVAKGDNATFPGLIIKLTKLCFETHGVKFIRDGSADFLADILYEFVSTNEKKKQKEDQFVKCLEQTMDNFLKAINCLRK